MTNLDILFYGIPIAIAIVGALSFGLGHSFGAQKGYLAGQLDALKSKDTDTIVE